MSETSRRNYEYRLRDKVGDERLNKEDSWGAFLVISIAATAEWVYLFIQAKILSSDLELFVIFFGFMLLFLVGIRFLPYHRLIFPRGNFKS